jgi:hypothetical protein
MTAEEYYYQILPDRGFASYTPEDEEIERISKHFGYSGKSMEEMRKIAEQVTPGRALEPLLADVVRNVPAKYERTSDDVFAGVFPLGGLNARVLPSPGGGFLILVNYKLKKALWEWAKLVVNVVFLQQENPELPPDASIERITSDFIESTQAYSDSEAIPAFPDYAKDEKTILVVMLHASAMKFVLAHEYSHILLGHVDVEPVNVSAISDSHVAALNSSEYYAKEFDADMMGAEIVLAQTSEEDFIRLDRDIQVIGIYYCLAIFEILEFIDAGHAYERTYEQVVRRMGAMQLFLGQKYESANRSIVNDFVRALDYLVVQSIVTLVKRPGSIGNDTPTPPAETKADYAGKQRVADLRAPEGGLQNLLDARRGPSEKATNDPRFLAFMRDFCDKKKSGDWGDMVRVASNTDRCSEYFDILVNHAVASSFGGVKDWDLPWRPDESLGSSGFIELALAILAAEQDKRDIRDVSLTTAQRSKILLVWRSLYGNTLCTIGSIDEPPPTSNNIEETMDKNVASIEIAKFLQDPVLMSFSSLAGAWAFERMGYGDRASTLKDDLNIDVEWPLISKNPDGSYRIVYPKFDHLGNQIPESLESKP